MLPSKATVSNTVASVPLSAYTNLFCEEIKRQGFSLSITFQHRFNVKFYCQQLCRHKNWLQLHF